MCDIIGVLERNTSRVATNYRWFYVCKGDIALNTSDFTTKDIERFWSKVAITDDPDQCWEWTACKSGNGYGAFALTHSRQVRAHRVAYALTNGGIPNGLCVLHQCDNPACCNPKHLSLGTNADNMRDKVGKKRQAYGEKNGRTKLTSDQVLYIINKYSGGNVGQVELAKEMKVSQQLISRIIRHEVWKQIDNSPDESW